MSKKKKKNVYTNFIKREFVIMIFVIWLMVIVLIGSSHAVFSSKTETGLTDVVVQSGNLLATISSDSEIIKMNYNTLGVSVK